MEQFPWWTKKQGELATEIEEFVDEVMPRSDEARWKREFPWDIFHTISEREYAGVDIPKNKRVEI